MDLLAEDYERFTLPVVGAGNLRVLVQSGRFAHGIVLWTELLDDIVHVFDVEFDFPTTTQDGE